MTLLNILHYPDNKLRQKGEKVNTFDENLKKIANDMLETMYAAKGIGLAAVQVNLPIRLIVIDISETRNEPIILVNPIINDRKEKLFLKRDVYQCLVFMKKLKDIMI